MTSTANGQRRRPNTRLHALPQRRGHHSARWKVGIRMVQARTRRVLPPPEPRQYSEPKITPSTGRRRLIRPAGPRSRSGDSGSNRLDTDIHDPVRGPRRKGPGQQSRRRHRAAEAGIRVLRVRAQGAGAAFRRSLSGASAGGGAHPGGPEDGPAYGGDRGLLHDIVEDTQGAFSWIRCGGNLGRKSRIWSTGSPSSGQTQFCRGKNARPRTSARCCWRWWTTSGSSWSSSRIGSTTCGRCIICPEERRIEIAQETLDIYAPIANRLGMSKIKSELEELSFKYLEPKAYESLRQRVESAAPRHRGMIEELRKTITAKLEEAQVPASDRRPDQAPIQHPSEAEAAEDRSRAGLRPGGAAHRHRARCATATRRSASSIRPGRRCRGASRTSSRCPGRTCINRCTRRWSASAGFPFEVQIRTDEMHRIAEEGIAAHWKYKEGRDRGRPRRAVFLWLRQLLEWQQEVRDPQEFLQNLKIDLYPEEVYIFTPKGEVKVLPRDATPVDFAYAIHTDVGHQCVGARVNGKMVPLRTRLRNGDIVEIVDHRRAQAEPRLAELRHHLAGAQQDQALHPRRGEDPQPGARTQAVREGGAPVRPERQDADRRGAVRGGADRRRISEGGRAVHRDRATASCRPGQSWRSWFRRNS